MKLSFYTYKLPFVKPFCTAKHKFYNRQGIYISLQKNSITALGEAAPLPGFSAEDLPTILKEVQQNAKTITSYFSASFSLDDTIQLLNTQKFSPSLQFGLYSLATGYLARQNQSPLQNTLFKNTASSVKMNTVLGQEDLNNLGKIDQLLSNGYKAIKIKGGENWRKIIPALEKIRSQNDSVKIRIDANQSWTLEKAQNCLQQLESYNIEYCEEPLTYPDEQSLNELQNNTSVPIALDESLLQSFSLKQAFELVPFIIIKPMILGKRAFSDELKKQAQIHNTKVIFTTALESGIGRLMTAALATGLGSENSAHGLATAQLLDRDIWTDKAFINDGNFTLPDAQGLKSLMSTDLTNLPVKKVLSHE